MRVKSSDGGVRMSAVDVHIGEARRMADYILCREHRGPGDTIDRAAYQAETKYGVPASFLLRLRRRHDISDMLLSNWLRLKTAYDAACEHQARQLRHDIDLENAVGKNAAPSTLVRTAIAISGAQNSAEDK